MPIYEYACTCGTQFEQFVLRKADEAGIACPRCGSVEVKRQLSRTAVGSVAGQRPSAGGRGCGPVG
jgi:putative FmdB family regulatory protein